MQESFSSSQIKSCLQPLYLSNEHFKARFLVQSQIEDPYVRQYEICSDSVRERRVAVRHYQAIDRQQENDIIQNMENYVLLGDIEGICKLVAFCKEQETQTISAAFQYDDFSLEEIIINRKYAQNRNELYTFILSQFIKTMSDAKQKGIIIEELVPSSILINQQSETSKMKVLYDERQKKYDKIQEGIKVLLSPEKLVESINGEESTDGYAESIFQLGLLMIDLIYEYEVKSEIEGQNQEVIRKDVPLARLNILHKGYLLFQDNFRVQLNSQLINQKSQYLRQLNNPTINQILALSQRMIDTVKSRIQWEDLRLRAYKIKSQANAEKQDQSKFVTPSKADLIKKHVINNRVTQNTIGVTKIITQTTVASYLPTDHKTIQSIDDNQGSKQISIEGLSFKISTNPQMKQRFQGFVNKMHGSCKTVQKKEYLDGSYYQGELTEKGKRQGSGIFVCNNGDIYFGRWDQNLLVEGNYIFKNGQSFQGLVKNGKQGFGTYHYNNGNVYEGQFQNDVKSGYGKMKYPNGDSYQGLWARGKKNGEGKYYYSNGILFEGSFVEGKKMGLGVITFPQKTKIEAYWNKTHIEGQGKVLYSNGNYFEGNFYISQKSGQGMYLWQDAKYQGEFLKDLMQGTAVIRYSDSEYYEGSIKNGKRDGRGVYKYANGDEFNGQWKNDQKLYGHYRFYEGRQFEGRFKRNQVNFGVMKYQCGQSYQGQFKDGLRDGQGIYRDAKGQIMLEGRWKNDQFVQKF